MFDLPVLPEGLILGATAFFIGVAFMSVVEVFERRYGKTLTKPDGWEAFFLIAIYVLCGLSCGLLFIFTLNNM